MEIRETDFGDMLDLMDDIPANTRLILVCANTGTGIRPTKVLLPHQLYVKDIASLRQGGADVVVIPITEDSVSLVWGDKANSTNGPLPAAMIRKMDRDALEYNRSK